jgi:hypothetical protein
MQPFQAEYQLQSNHELTSDADKDLFSGEHQVDRRGPKTIENHHDQT